MQNQPTHPTRDSADADTNSEVEALRQQISDLVANVRRNEDVMRRFHNLELRLISVKDFDELLHTMLFHHRKAFDLDAISLAIIDQEYGIRRMLELNNIEADDFPDLVIVDDPAELVDLYGADPKPLLGNYDPHRHGLLFPPSLPLPDGVALLPLLRNGRLTGSLNLGSHDTDRFTPALATDFLGRLAAIASVCLDNVISHEHVKNTGLTDPLTGVHNRRYFEQRLREEIGRNQRQGQPLSCLLLDIDYFKSVNDTHGHQAGDQVLQETAARIKGQLRLSDALVRYGGEEFAALLTQTDHTVAISIAERIRQSIADKTFRLAGNAGGGLTVTISIGVATLDGATRTDSLRSGSTDELAQKLVAGADAALYRAKESGRNRVVSNAST